MQHFVPRRTLALLGLLVSGACASGGASAPAPAAADDPAIPGRQETRRTVITAADIPENSTENVYELVQRLHPEFLRTRVGSRTATRGVATPLPSLFVDGQRVGDAEDLRRIAASQIALIRSYTLEETKRRFGMQFETAGIELVYKK